LNINPSTGAILVLNILKHLTFIPFWSDPVFSGILCDDGPSGFVAEKDKKTPLDGSRTR
jgi:hypothetical protein